MNAIQPELVEKYQLMLQQDPKSRVFAPLSEAYRKMGLHEEALEICQSGVLANPDFAGGRIALARILMQLNQYDKAAPELKVATELSPENVLAFSLLAECYLHLKDGKEALKAYKMQLFLNPQDERAQRAVKKLEVLTADEFEDEVFNMKPLKIASASMEEVLQIEPLTPTLSDQKKSRDIERFLSLADAYLVRNDTDRAIETLNEAEQIHGSLPEIVKRLKMLHQKHFEQENEIATQQDSEGPPLSRQESLRKQQIQSLQIALKRVRAAKIQTP